MWIKLRERLEIVIGFNKIKTIKRNRKDLINKRRYWEVEVVVAVNG